MIFWTRTATEGDRRIASPQKRLGTVQPTASPRVGPNDVFRASQGVGLLGGQVVNSELVERNMDDAQTLFGPFTQPCLRTDRVMGRYFREKPSSQAFDPTAVGFFYAYEHHPNLFNQLTRLASLLSLRQVLNADFYEIILR